MHAPIRTRGHCSLDSPVPLLVLLLTLLLSSGCAQQQMLPTDNNSSITPAGWPAHQKKMQSLKHWRAEGKLGYRSETGNGSAWFDWTQYGETFTIYLSGPFGAGTVKISGTPTAIILSQPGEADIAASSSALLTQKLFGWHLPVEQLRYWARGIPNPLDLVSTQTFDQEGMLTSLIQHDWQIDLNNYQVTPQGQLPGKIKAIQLTRGSDTKDTLSFTLVFKSWDFPQAPQQSQTAAP